jgi:Spy/CpxP family protein refolding chaperone
MSLFRIAAVVCVALTITSAAVAQDQDGQRRGRGPGGGGGFGDFGGASLLRNEAVQKELELVDDQKAKLTKLGEGMRAEFTEMFQGMRDLSSEERREKFASIREKMTNVREKLQKDIDGILLPHQRDRLAQIQFQSQNRGRGTSGALSSDSVAEKLGITKEQQEKIAKLGTEIQEEMTKKIQELRLKAQEKLLEVLTPDQKAQWEKLAGEPFELPRSQFGRRDGGREGDRRRRPESGN